MYNLLLPFIFTSHSIACPIRQVAGSGAITIHGRCTLLVWALQVLSGDEVLDSPLDETHFRLEIPREYR